MLYVQYAPIIILGHCGGQLLKIPEPHAKGLARTHNHTAARGRQQLWEEVLGGGGRRRRRRSRRRAEHQEEQRQEEKEEEEEEEKEGGA